MKTQTLLILTVILLLLTPNFVTAQKGIRIGYIDMDYILENVSEYNQAAAELETKVQKWKVEIEAELKAVEQMKKDLNNERVLLTKELIEEREEDILFKEKEILEYQQKRFGPNGDLFLQKKRLVQPVQDQVFVAVQEVAKNKKYDFVFDRSADLIMLYSADRHDISDQVLQKISRVSKRKQLNSKKERKAAEKAQDKSNGTEKKSSKKELELQKRQKLKEELLAQRKAQRDSIRAARTKEFQERRAKLIETQKRKKDSIAALKKKKEELKKEGEDASGEKNNL